MGITCKPIGKFKSEMKKLDNRMKKEQEANKNKSQKKEKT
jgi:Sec-independent protein translocase protein TatA